MKTKFLNKPWFKAKNAGAWCVYYNTEWEGRTLKNFVCECVNEAAANQIVMMQNSHVQMMRYLLGDIESQPLPMPTYKD